MTLSEADTNRLPAYVHLPALPQVSISSFAKLRFHPPSRNMAIANRTANAARATRSLASDWLSKCPGIYGTSLPGFNWLRIRRFEQCVVKLESVQRWPLQRMVTEKVAAIEIHPGLDDKLRRTQKQSGSCMIYWALCLLLLSSLFISSLLYIRSEHKSCGFFCGRKNCFGTLKSCVCRRDIACICLVM